MWLNFWQAAGSFRLSWCTKVQLFQLCSYCRKIYLRLYLEFCQCGFYSSFIQRTVSLHPFFCLLNFLVWFIHFVLRKWTFYGKYSFHKFFILLLNNFEWILLIDRIGCSHSGFVQNIGLWHYFMSLRLTISCINNLFVK